MFILSFFAITTAVDVLDDHAHDWVLFNDETASLLEKPVPFERGTHRPLPSPHREYKCMSCGFIFNEYEQGRLMDCDKVRCPSCNTQARKAFGSCGGPTIASDPFVRKFTCRNCGFIWDENSVGPLDCESRVCPNCGWPAKAAYVGCVPGFQTYVCRNCGEIYVELDRGALDCRRDACPYCGTAPHVAYRECVAIHKMSISFCMQNPSYGVPGWDCEMKLEAFCKSPAHNCRKICLEHPFIPACQSFGLPAWGLPHVDPVEPEA